MTVTCSNPKDSVSPSAQDLGRPGKIVRRISQELVREIIEWDVPNWSSSLTFWQGHTRQDLTAVKALEIGSKRGGLSLWIALQGGQAHCTDLRDPSSVALKSHVLHGVGGRITYDSLDALRMPYEEQFDAVMFKSLLADVGRFKGKAGMAEVVRQSHKALKKGGELFFAENLSGSPLHRILRRWFVPWGRDMLYPTIAGMLDFFGPFASVQYETMGFLGVFGRRDWQSNLLGGLDRKGFDRLVPKKWHYLMIGVARK
jgi:SAM-dependent methyltransferase